LAFDMAKNILATRTHKTLADRLDAIRINLLAHAGGPAYITERLCRWPSEADVDYFGDQPNTNTQLAATYLNNGQLKTIGRLQRAFLNNYARRITCKINQYVFQGAPTRTGIDPAWAIDVTQTGASINQFMDQVSELLTVCRWCWIGVDRPAAVGPRSKADVERSGDRVYWQLYDPTEIVDWNFDAHGKLTWLLLERSEYTNTDPRVEAAEQTVRYLYEPGRVTRMPFADDQETFVEMTETPTGYTGIPFTLVGNATSASWWFDDVERIQRSIMDLHSSLDTSIFKSVFPVLVVSQTFSDSLRSDKIDANAARRKIGTGNPIVESAEESGITRWLSGTATDLKFIRDEIDRRQSDLYDTVGLAMKTPESRQVASAEAKAWDHLDTEAVLAERAGILEEAEQRSVELSSLFGGAIFKPYKVSYQRRFDLSDFAADIKAITEAGALNLPPEAEKMLAKAAMRSAGKRFSNTPQEIDAVMKAIDTYEPPEPVYTPPTPPDGNPPAA
jgi:hypothetical protein